METKFAMDDLAYEDLLDTGVRNEALPIWQSGWEHASWAPEQAEVGVGHGAIARMAARIPTSMRWPARTAADTNTAHRPATH